MLNIKICRECYINFPKGNRVHTITARKLFDHGWEVFREIHCMKIAPGQVLKINDEPPEECPYVLEHLLIEDKE